MSANAGANTDDGSDAARTSFETSVAAFIEDSGIPQVRIARSLGYANANILTMFKRGTTRVPPGKVVALARILGQDPGSLLRRWFMAYMPDVVADLDRYF
jgi:hypothetical protein